MSILCKKEENKELEQIKENKEKEFLLGKRERNEIEEIICLVSEEEDEGIERKEMGKETKERKELELEIENDREIQTKENRKEMNLLDWMSEWEAESEKESNGGEMEEVLCLCGENIMMITESERELHVSRCLANVPSGAAVSRQMMPIMLSPNSKV